MTIFFIGIGIMFSGIIYYAVKLRQIEKEFLEMRRRHYARDLTDASEKAHAKIQRDIASKSIDDLLRDEK